MNTRIWKNETLAFWLAPLVSVLPLLPLFGIPSSPLFLGRLTVDPTHPTNWPVWGPWLSTVAVVFDGTILAYFAAAFVALPIYELYRSRGKVSVVGICVLFGFAGICASQFVHLVQNFKQPGLRDFADSWWSPLIGCLCGLMGGMFFSLFARGGVPPAARAFIYPLPVGILVASGFVLIEAARVWHGR